MKPCSLERSLHILGPVLGRKRGVDVRIGGTRACTDGNTIWLPALPIDDAEAAALGFGLLFHETNHLRYTDFAVAKGEGLVGALTNALEDVRVDALGQQEYRGALREEEALVGALIRRGEAKACNADAPAARILESYLMWRLEHEVLGVAAARGLAEQAAHAFGKTFAPGVQAKLDALMFGVRDCHSTLEAQALAQRIAQMLNDEAGAQAALRSANPQQPAEATHAHASPLRQALDAAPEDHASSIGELTRTAVNAKGREAPALNVPLARGSSSRFAPSAAAGVNFAPEVKAATNALRHRLAGLLQAETLCRRYPALTGRRIDTRRLGRIEGGEARLFVRETAGLQTDTAVQILLDRSGSMGASRGRERAGTPRPIEVARAACYATALALQAVPGIALAAAAFPGHRPGEVTVLTDFLERVDRQVARFASLEAGGGTPLAEALLWGAGELLGQRRARRLVLLATDGAVDADLGRAMTARLSGAGIETLGIGIHCDVSHLVVRSRRVATISDLPQAMFELLLEALRWPARNHGALHG
jgi:cobaltochelatase CobT